MAGGGSRVRLGALPGSFPFKSVHASPSHCHHFRLSLGPISLLLLRDSLCNPTTATQITSLSWVKPSCGFHHEWMVPTRTLPGSLTHPGSTRPSCLRASAMLFLPCPRRGLPNIPS